LTAGGRDERPSRRGTGGLRWLFLAAAAFFLLVGYLQIRGIVRSGRIAAVGDGRNVASYGFDLTTCLVPRATLVAAGMPKDTLEPLNMQYLLTAAQVDSLNAAERGKYLVPDDLVIGVVIGGVPRAYPTRVLDWHEVTNDTLGGRPIAVTWHPLCGSSVVFDRRVAGETLTFGQSGLLTNSNLLLYDRRDDTADESLWSQLQARAVAGPAAGSVAGPAAGPAGVRGDSLIVLPHVLTSWSRWRAAYPQTTVPLPDPSRRKSYARRPYGSYEGSDLLRFPVAPLPPPAGHRYKSRIRAERRGGGWDVEFVDVREEPAGPRRGPALPTVYAYWFAWYAAQSPIR